MKKLSSNGNRSPNRISNDVLSVNTIPSVSLVAFFPLILLSPVTFPPSLLCLFHLPVIPFLIHFRSSSSGCTDHINCFPESSIFGYDLSEERTMLLETENGLQSLSRAVSHDPTTIPRAERKTTLRQKKDKKTRGMTSSLVSLKYSVELFFVFKSRREETEDIKSRGQKVI